MCIRDSPKKRIRKQHKKPHKASREHKADYYADSILSFRFWSCRSNKYHWCKIETGFLCGDGARVIRFYARVLPHLGFRTQKMEANVDYCYVRRHAECTSLGPGLEHPSLRSDSSLAAKRRAEALHVVFFPIKHPSPTRRLTAAFVYCSSWCLGPTPRRPIAG